MSSDQSLTARDYPTFVALLADRAAGRPDEVVYSFLPNGEPPEVVITNAGLDRRARALAARLQQLGATGERVLILYQPSLEYIVAFYGCLYAGAVAVPAYPPRRNRSIYRLRSIAAESDAKIGLTTTAILSGLQRHLAEAPELGRMQWVAAEEGDGGVTPEDWVDPRVTREDLALLQYTSGSTATPKGVMVTHGNLMQNSRLIRECAGLTVEDRGIFWLPPYHDMGLIGGILQPLYVGGHTTLMPPTAFLQRPYRWLKAVSDLKATTSCGPNFAYEMCVRAVTPEQRETLDLSSWELAYCGSEPIRIDTLERFAAYFEPCGFRMSAFYPCYGLAEATLFVSGGRRDTPPVVTPFSAAALKGHGIAEASDAADAQRLVGCGPAAPGSKVVVVDTETMLACPPDRAGEIWVAGESVARGYWNQPEESARTFDARLAEGEGPFMRTGDIGFMRDGQLYVTGRLKDLIIIRGLNHYPQDIEKTAELSHAALQPGSGAAFSIEADGEERLVVAYEVERRNRRPDVEQIAEAVRRAVAVEHQIEIYALALVEVFGIPKTSSGKVQRRACRDAYLGGTLPLVGEWKQPCAQGDSADVTEHNVTAESITEAVAVHTSANAQDVEAGGVSDASVSRSAGEIRAWLAARIAALSGVRPAEVDVDKPFELFGLDSLKAVQLSSELETWLARQLSPTLLWDYPNIRALSGHLSGEADTAPARADAPATDDAVADAVAIIGMGCRFPGGASSPARFWSLLHDGRDAVSEVPASRWDLSAYYDPDPAAPGKMYTRWGGFLAEDPALFDAPFFRVSPREAGAMDPQQRLLLEVSWEALEDAGALGRGVAGTDAGVFVGISTNDYLHLQLKQRDPSLVDSYSGTGNALSIAANRLSYTLGLQGPSMAIDTACSSSLVAIHLACRSLRTGECSLAIAGGVNLMLSPEPTVNFSKARMMARDGRCKTFDAEADGYVRGEGCGLIVLKRLADAQRDGDRVLAVVRGSAVNQDGSSNGLTAPNGPAQETVIRAALSDARVLPSEVSYVEAHGTGTALGDPIEVRALASVFAGVRRLTIGSVKTNVGHLEAAAGVAGLIKVILALRHGEIPPHLHFKEPSPHIRWREIPIVVPTVCEAWEARDGRLVAGVSSFGFGGTNAHVVLEAAPRVGVDDEDGSRPDRTHHLLPLSAKSEEALRALAGSYAEHLASHASVSPADVAHTAATCRDHFAHRLAVVGERGEMLEQLVRVADERHYAGAQPGSAEASEDRGVAFLFTGQGSQYAGMGRELFDTSPTFRRSLERCAELLKPHLERPLLSVLFPAEGERAALDQTAYAQPALFALEWSLVELWRSWGIEPAVVLGHSVGEYVAACVAGVFSLEEGLALVAERGRLMQDLPRDGSMAAVFADESRVREAASRYADRLSIAAVNGPLETVVSGDAESLKEVLTKLEADGIRARRLNVSHAFHSPLMEPMLDEFERVASRVNFSAPRIGIVSNLDGKAVNGEGLASADYWLRHVSGAVRFSAGMQTLDREGYQTFLEVGPHPVLLGMGRQCVTEDARRAWLPTLRRGRGEWRQMLESLGALYVRGREVNWRALDADYKRRRVELPTYPFRRERYWFEQTQQDSPAVSPARAPESAAAVKPVGDFARSLEEAPAPERLDLLTARIQGEVAEVLRLPAPPDPRQGFFEMGMDSLMAVELRARLERSIGESLPATLAFDYPNIKALARYLLREVLKLEPREAARRARTPRRTPDEPLAVVGIGCRFPAGANDPEGFWRLLSEGRDGVTLVPASRWDAEGYYDPDPEAPGKSYTREGAFLDVEVDKFDARFFNIAPREAASIDPQQRLLLELCWEALEHAGQAPEKLSGSRAGVFVGINTNDYTRRLLLSGDLSALDAYTFTGNTFSVAAGRISHLLGLQGPSMAIDTACSSSLVAIHLACRSLREGECDLALAGGVNLMLSPEASVVLSRMRALAPDGRCKTFDAAADGYARGEGGGLVVLKRLSDALAGGDDILALVRGSAMNHDGASGGLTVPNGVAQQSLLAAALEDAGVEPERVSYLEAHGTGTPLGDPIEMDAVRQVFCLGRSADSPLTVGSVKTNVGHLEAAAGVAGLIKVVLALRHREIPPHLHFRSPSPHIRWDELPVHIPTERIEWRNGDGPRLAGVSSFGMSGTNAHVVLEEAPAPRREDVGLERPRHLLALSARTEPALAQLAASYASHLGANPTASLPDVAYTANTGRSHFAHRLAVTADSAEQLRARLSSFTTTGEGITRGQASASTRPRVAFLFTGQGSQYAGMGRELYDTSPAFRRALERCAELLKPHLEAPLLSVLFPAEGEHSPIDETAYAQPALFAFEWALAELWRSWGVEPSMVAGHSVGEYVAACVAGVFSLEDALALIAERGRLMQRLPRVGAMAAVFACEERLRAALEAYGESLSIAAVNGPLETVVSGDAESLKEVLTKLEADGIRARRLNVSHAFHSPLMEPMLDEFGRVASRVNFSAPQLRLISNLSGVEAVADDATTPAYWRRHAREAVRFADCLRSLERLDCGALLEIGPQPVLTRMGQERAAAENGGASQAWLASVRRGRGEWEQMLESLAALYVNGQEVDWEGFDRGYGRRRTALPTYPFQRKRHWIDLPGENARAPRPKARTEDEPEAFGDWLHEIRWRPADVEGARPDADATHTGGGWIVYADRGSIAAEIKRTLEARGGTCVMVTRGDAFMNVDGREFVLDPERPEHSEQLLAATLKAEGTHDFRGVIHLWSLDAPAEPDAAALEVAQAEGCYSVLHLVQALVKSGVSAPPKLWLVTRGAQLVEPGQHVVSPAQAALWGLGRVIPLEHPEIFGGLIDLDPTCGAEESAASIRRELSADDGEEQVAFRGGRRFVARVASGVGHEQLKASTELRPDATYLVTGGLGSLGLKVASSLIERGARNLLLTGRSEPSEPAQRAIEKMERAGARVHVARADVSRMEQIAAALDEAGLSMPPLRGVVHAAGVLDDGVLFMQTRERFAAVMAPKVQGAWNLHLLTKEHALDFFVMFSSAASLLGSPGQGNYAAANSFMDALAHMRRSLGLPGLSINWGPWGESGMAADLARRSSRQWTPQGVTQLSTTQGLRVLERLLASQPAQVCVMPVDWAEFIRQFPAGSKLKVLEEVAGGARPGESEAAAGEPELLRLLADAPSNERRDLLVTHLQREVANVLGLDESETVDPEQGFFEMGLDSLMAVELKNYLGANLGQFLPSTLTFQYPNIAAMSDYLLGDVLVFSGGNGAAPASAGHEDVRLEGVSEDELLSLLADELSRIDESRHGGRGGER